MFLSKFLLKRPLVVNLLTLVILLLGILVLTSVNRATYPDVNFELMMVTTEYPGASSEDVEVNVTNKIEEKLEEVDGIDRVRSLSLENLSLIYIWLDLNATDPQAIKTDIRNAVDRVSDLPSEVSYKPSIEEFKSGNLPLMEIAVTGGKDEGERRLIAEALEDRIKDLSGVARITKNGYRKREIKIKADPKKLRRKKVSLVEIAKALKERNLRVSGGNFSSPGYLKKVITYSEFKDIEDVKNLIIRSNYSGRQVYLKDVAEVTEGYQKAKVLTKTNGSPSINLVVRAQAKADIIDLSDDIKTTIDELKKGFPKGVKAQIVNNMSYYTNSLLRIVQNNALIGGLFVIISLVVFLSKKVAFWTAFGIPLSLLGAVIFFPTLGVSINIITLITMILVLGLLVDDAIVVAENITRHREMGKEQVNAAIDGVREMFWPVTTTIITTILAFLPMFFLSGILGRFIYTIPVVVVAALIFSLFECTCLLPAHVAMGKSTGKDKEAVWWTRIKNLYEELLKGFLKRRFLTILLFIGFLGFSGVLFKAKMTYVLFPYNDVDSLFVLAEMPEGTPLQTTSKKMEAVEAFVSKVAGKESSGYITTIGHHDTDPYGATGGQKENHALITLILKPAIQRAKTSETIMRDIEKGLLDLTKKQGFTKLWTKKYKDGPPVGRPVTLSVVTKNTELRNKVSKDIFDFLSRVKGVVDLESDMKEGQNELRIIPNYYKMGRLGVTVETVAHTLRVAFQGSVPTKIVQEGEEIDFRLQISKKGFEDEREILKKVQVMNQRGRLLDLLPLVKLQEVRGQTIIRHYNGKPSVTISSDLDEKLTTSKKVKQLIQEKFKGQIEGTPGLQIVFGGEEKATEESIQDFIIAFPFCILGIYFVLVILFNSLIQPFIILATIPFGLAGVVISFYVFNLPLSFLGMIGSLGLVGIIVNDGLIMVSHLNQISMGRELTMELVLKGAKDRFRAVMLTTVTTVLGMAPTIFGIGGYEPFLVPIVLAVAGGLIFATTLILIFIPILYSFKIKK